MAYLIRYMPVHFFYSRNNDEPTPKNRYLEVSPLYIGRKGHFFAKIDLLEQAQ